MIILYIILILFLLLILYLMFAPLIVELSFERMFLSIRFHKAASFTVNYENEKWNFILKLLWWKKDIRELKGNTGKKEKVELEKKEEKKKSKKRKLPFKRIKNVIRSFNVKTCIVSIDTNDAATNGLLFPVFYGLFRLTGKSFSINFKGEQRVELFIKNNVARMLWAFIKPIN